MLFFIIINIILTGVIIILIIKLFHDLSLKKEDLSKIKKYVEIISKLRREKNRLLRKLGKESLDNRTPVDIPNPSYVSIRVIEEELDSLKTTINLDNNQCLLPQLRKRFEYIIDELEQLL